MRVLLTNDDGIEAEGLQALRRRLVAIDGVELAVVAPDGNRSATARSITTRRPLTVREVTFEDGTVGYATDGTPVDCVRLGHLGVVHGFTAELVVSGINHGANLGDDVTYSGTVAAALEARMLGLPGIAVSQQAPARDVDWSDEAEAVFEDGARFAAAIVERLPANGLPAGTLLNVNLPAVRARGVRVVRLGRRVYTDALTLVHEDADGRSYEIYGQAGRDETETDTDLAAVADGLIAVTPLHFDLTDAGAFDAVARADLGALIRPAAERVTER